MTFFCSEGDVRRAQQALGLPDSAFPRSVDEGESVELKEEIYDMD